MCTRRTRITPGIVTHYTFIPAIKANAATIVAFKIFFFILFLVLKMINDSCFHLILGKNSTAEKTKLLLVRLFR
ncbi:hypothetical protein D3Z46_01065 [Bacteroides sartorii]|nr:hypothetical protein [Phocaeicola sartorii]